MAASKKYKYDIFLSWTGADRNVKNQIAERFGELSVYDSDVECNGLFRENFCKALDESKVYLLILTDNLMNANKDSTYLTEVRREISLACDLEANNELNMVVLCLSPYFRFKNGFNEWDTNPIGALIRSYLAGFSRIDARLTEEGLLEESAFSKLRHDVDDFVLNRDKGTPIASQAPRYFVKKKKLPTVTDFVGRTKDLSDICNAYKAGAQVVVLSGMGGIGKTKIAEEFANFSDKNMFKCLQITQIQDVVNTEHAGLNAFVSEVDYVDSLYFEIENLNETEKFKRKLAALEELPDTTILVVDNFNSLSESILQSILDKLSCKLLITTRKTNLDQEKFGSAAKILDIQSLDRDEAYEMFCKNAKIEITKERFYEMHRAVGGHTMTLCIMAKIINKHKIDFDAMLDKMNSLDAMSEKVEFSHNDFNSDQATVDTVMGHLRDLFDMSKLDDNCIRVLVNMSMLSDGTITEKSIREILGLTTRNEIIDLTEQGWLTESGGEEPTLYLHPILSQLVFTLYTPTQYEAMPILDYLCGEFDETYDDLTYGKARAMDNRMFFPLLRLAITTRRIYTPLWERYVRVSAFIGDVNDILAKKQRLQEHLIDEADNALVANHYETTYLAQNPADSEKIRQFLIQLAEVNDCKTVINSFLNSPIAGMVDVFPDCEELLKIALGKALDDAIAKEDGMCVIQIAACEWAMGKQYHFNKIKKYASKRKKNSGGAILLELCLMSFKFNKDMSAISDTLSILGNPSKENDAKLGRLVLKNLGTVIKAISLMKRTEKVSPDDPYYDFISELMNFSVSLADEGSINIDGFFNLMLKMSDIMIKNDLRVNMERVIQNTINLVYSFAAQMGNDLKKYVVQELPDAQSLKLGNISSVYMSYKIGELIGDESALKQSQLLLEFELGKQPEKNYAVAKEYIRHGDVCTRFRRFINAYAYYRKAYDIMSKVVPNTVELGNLCLKLIQTSVNFVEAKVLRGYFDTALVCFSDNADRYYAYRDYINCLINYYSSLTSPSSGKIYVVNNGQRMGVRSEFFDKELSSVVNDFDKIVYGAQSLPEKTVNDMGLLFNNKRVPLQKLQFFYRSDFLKQINDRFGSYFEFLASFNYASRMLLYYSQATERYSNKDFVSAVKIGSDAVRLAIKKRSNIYSVLNYNGYYYLLSAMELSAEKREVMQEPTNSNSNAVDVKDSSSATAVSTVVGWDVTQFVNILFGTKGKEREKALAMFEYMLSQYNSRDFYVYFENAVKKLYVNKFNVMDVTVMKLRGSANKRYNKYMLRVVTNLLNSINDVFCN